MRPRTSAPKTSRPASERRVAARFSGLLFDIAKVLRRRQASGVVVCSGGGIGIQSVGERELDARSVLGLHGDDGDLALLAGLVVQAKAPYGVGQSPVGGSHLPSRPPGAHDLDHELAADRSGWGDGGRVERLSLAMARASISRTRSRVRLKCRLTSSSVHDSSPRTSSSGSS